MMAIPWPPPMHIVSSPNWPSRAVRPLSRVVVMRAPVEPNGWPRAIAPPWTLSLSVSMPRSSTEASTCAANASLISIRSMSLMDMPARARARRDDSTGPIPMISGERAVTPVETTRERGQAQVTGLGVAHDHERCRTVVERAAVAGGDGTGLAEHRFERGQGIERDAGARAVIGGDNGAVRRRDRGDLAGEEAIDDGFLCAVLADDSPFVLACQRDAAAGCDVLGGLAHRHVDVGQQVLFAGVGPGGVVGGHPGAAGLGCGELRVLRLSPGAAGTGEIRIARDTLDAGADE